MVARSSPRRAAVMLEPRGQLGFLKGLHIRAASDVLQSLLNGAIIRLVPGEEILHFFRVLRVAEHAGG